MLLQVIMLIICIRRYSVCVGRVNAVIYVCTLCVDDYIPTCSSAVNYIHNLLHIQIVVSHHSKKLITYYMYTGKFGVSADQPTYCQIKISSVHIHLYIHVHVHDDIILYHQFTNLSTFLKFTFGPKPPTFPAICSCTYSDCNI